jgi:hypothetical protein
MAPSPSDIERHASKETGEQAEFDEHDYVGAEPNEQVLWLRRS